jgi:hypothetical protein
MVEGQKLGDLGFFRSSNRTLRKERAAVSRSCTSEVAITRLLKERKSVVGPVQPFLAPKLGTP